MPQTQIYFVVDQQTSTPEAHAAFYTDPVIVAASQSPYAHPRPQLRDSLDGSLRLVEVGIDPAEVARLLDGAAALGVGITVLGTPPDYADSNRAALDYLAANRAEWEPE